MPFALNNDPSQSEISEAINYLLANFGSNLVADPTNGQISGPSGILIAYLYRYLAVKYADSFDGSLNFSNSPTGRLYYGLRNTDDTTESTNPADYIWYKVTGGFSTTKFLYYQTGGGRQIQFVVATSSPGATYVQESGPAIDLDVITTTTAYNTASPSIYIWTSTSTPPTRPTTTSTYTWATGAYTAPVGWTTTPTSNTTPGSYLWAITIPLVVPSSTVTSTLNWTNTSYLIYAFSFNGDTGAAGLSALTAYLALDQADPAPSTPANTTGPTAPSGWALTAPSVTVGDVLWYSFGRYNSSSATIDGVLAGQTKWGTPTAASIFQDIRSDNWNGGVGGTGGPPTFGIPSTYGTLGYYIQQASGDVFFNNGIFRADISTNGDALFYGQTLSTQQILVNGSQYKMDYSCYAEALTLPTVDAMRVGYYGRAAAAPNLSVKPTAYNVGVVGYGQNFIGSEGYGIVGVGDSVGGYFQGSQYGAIINGVGTIPVGVAIAGKINWGIYSIPVPTGSTTTYLRNDGTWSTVTATTAINATYSVYLGNSTDNFTTYSSGSVLGVKSNAVTIGLVNSSNNGVFYNGSGTVAFCPTADNVTALGASSLRWTTVFATTPVINTSDGNQKQDIEQLSVAELAVATRIKSLIKKFRFKDAVQIKGNDARIHVGVIAQDVRDAFAAEGLDANRYGMFCSDTDKNGITTLGVRYEELLAFVIAAM